MRPFNLLVLLITHQNTLNFTQITLIGFSPELPPLPSFDHSPEFRGPISNVTAAVSREAILNCLVTDLGQYKVAWVRAEDQTILSIDTRVITHNPRISVSHDHNLNTWQLKIRQLKESDRGCYVCQINTSSMKKSVGCIDVKVPPDINDNETSTDITVSEGDNATLVCRASGHPPPRILWRREDSNRILLHPRQHATQKVGTFVGPKLNLVRVERHQMGAYMCIASNDVPPAVSKRITLYINFIPVINVPNQLLGAPLHTNVTLECNVEAHPNTINYWMKNRSEILIGGKKHSILEERNGYKVHMTLTVHNILKRDIGTYMCVATNSMGKADGMLRLYEIKLAETKAPVAEIKTSTESKVIMQTSSTTESMMNALIKEKIIENDLPSDPSPMETIVSKSSLALCPIPNYINGIVLISIISVR